MGTIRFQVGRTYATRSICDSGCIFSETIVTRTEKTVTTASGKVFRLSVYEGVEQFFPTGKYSMAPRISADKEYRK